MANAPEPVYPYDLGSFGRPVTTNSDEAQTWFNRGLTWAYAFNHEEAVVCFKQAVIHDESCAMAHWGIAYSLGPHYNRPWEAFGSELGSVVQKTYQAARMALSLAANASPVEKALIDAIQTRYQSDQCTSLEQYTTQSREYADAMGAVYRLFSDDLDVAALFADSLISLNPWKLWNLQTGKPNPGTRAAEAKHVLESAFEGNKDSLKHPGLLHMYIHLIEMHTPELGLKASDHLRNLVPDAGHLNHMPSHIDLQVGDYAGAIQANQQAITADEKFLEKEGALNFYSLYRMHNYHSLVFAAMFAGQKRNALEAVEQMEATMPETLLTSMADIFEAFRSVRWHVMVRFGLWKDIIELPLPSNPDVLCATTATAHYAKGVAWAASNNVVEAERERGLYLEALQRVPRSRLNYPNTCHDVLAVASAMLEGEIEYRRGNYAKAFEQLRLSVELDDGLVYSEPWGWMQPARHAYAALLLEQDHVEEAADVYRADLGLDDTCMRARHHPKNVWALQGYYECLERLGRSAEAQLMEPQLKAAVALADVAVTSSCFCRRDNSQVPCCADNPSVTLG